MKLYTEEQVIQILYWMSPTYMGREQVEEQIKKELTPIELPSDEEIEKEVKLIEPYATNDYCDGFSDGINWYKNKIGKKMKEQILNQNK